MNKNTESPLHRRIRALMAVAKDKSITEAEAAAFAAKVQALLAEHGLSMADVREVNEESMGTQDFPQQRWNTPARKKLLNAVCRYYMCESLSPGYKGDTWTIIGRPANVAVAVEMTDYLIKTVIRMSNEHGKTHGRKPKHVIDYRRGAMLRLCVRLSLLRAEAMTQKAEWHGTNPGNLPALFMSEDALIAEQVKKFDTQERSARGLKLGGDAAMGMRAAENIGLHEQVQGPRGGRLAIGRESK